MDLYREDTYEIKYGLEVDAEPPLVGPWNCTEVDKRLTFDGWEGFTVVEVEDNAWQLYFDFDDNGLDKKVSMTKRVMEVELTRTEVRVKKGDSFIPP